MTFLPIVQRELQSQSRRGMTYWSRCLAACAAVLFCFQFFLSFGFMWEASVSGRAAYNALTAMALLLACGGALLTADCISVEKREGTLGLLFLTSLRGHDVALGKLAVNGLGGIYVMLGFAPVMAVPLLTGGITGDEMFRMMLAIMNALWLALAVGLWVSTRSLTQFDAMRKALLRMIMLVLLPWIFACLSFSVAGVTLSVAMISPIYAMRSGAAENYADEPGTYWVSLVVVQGVSWFYLLAAGQSLAKSWRAASLYSLRQEDEENVISPIKWSNISYTGRINLGKFGPICARVLRIPGQTAIVWIATGLAVLNSIMWATYQLSSLLDDAPVTGACVGIGLVIDLASAGLIASVAGRFIFGARQSGELEMLLCTPAGAQEMLSGQWRALRHRLIWPALVALTATFAVSLSYGGEFLPGPLSLLYAALRVMEGIFYLLAICSLGMWFGSVTRKFVTAIVATLALAVGLPWVAVSLVYALVSVQTWEYGLIIVNMAISVGTSVFNFMLFRWAQAKLQKQFRNFSAQSWSEFVKRTSEGPLQTA